MMRIAVLCLVCAPALAAADKTYTDGKGGSWDCAKDSKVSIVANAGTYTLKGACMEVNISGNQNKVAVDSAAHLIVNGNENTVAAVAVAQITANGNKNSVTYKKAVNGKGKAQISNPGSDNKITWNK